MIKSNILSKVTVPAAIIATLFFVINIILLTHGHFHEDAYILFIYVNNMLNDYGITFYQSGPPTEGAVDFLWMIMLFIIARIGFDVGTAAVLLNSIGVLIICYLITKELNAARLKNKLHLAFAYLLSSLWITQSPLIAAVGGFSVFLYMSLILLAFTMIKEERNILWIPIISLTIALFRPDGVIIGVGFSMLGLIISNKKSLLKQYLLISLCSFIIGVSYFIWRYNYFGNLLPLPLYVKSHDSILAGLYANFNWARASIFILLPALILSIINKNITHYIKISSPVILLFIALLTATQSQNVGFRFQAPIMIIAYFILASELMKLVTIKNCRKHLIVASLVIFPSVLIGMKNIYSSSAGIVHFNYINQVPFEINKILPSDSTIALTEAGRLAYWNQAGNHKIVDLVGLNSAYPAMNTINANYIKQLDPDLLMYHQAELLDLTYLNNDNRNVIPVSDKLFRLLHNKKQLSNNILELKSKVYNASYSSTEFLRENFEKYDVFFVRYDSNYSHIYAFKRDLGLSIQMSKVIKDSFDIKNKTAYYDY